jgi:hydrogenase/urease accessory protein HupE
MYEILWKQPIVQNRRLPIDPIFPEGCELSDVVPPDVAPGALLYTWSTFCDLTDAVIHIDGLSVTLTDVMVRWTSADGEVRNYLLRPENPTLDLGGQSVSTLSYLTIGIEHLIFGIDHVLFVIGLVLFIKQPLMLLKTVTAFTIAHSITLALSVLGWVQLDQGPIEAVIALSIVFLARELMLPENKRSRLTLGRPWVMALFFGLLHGLGFAGALRDIGLPDDTLWLSLLLFNVGIEIGQLAVIGVMFAILWAANRLTKRIRFATALPNYAALAMGCVAMYWTIDRTLLLV